MTNELESQPYKLVEETITDLENLKQSYDALKKIEQSCSSGIAYEILHRKIIDLEQIKEFLDAILDNFDYDEMQGVPP